MARSRPSRYAQLKRLETASADQPSENVVPLAAAQSWRPNVQYAVKESGAILLIEPERGKELYNVTLLLALPNLWKPFADGLLAWFCNPKINSRSGRRAIISHVRSQLVGPTCKCQCCPI